MRANGTTLLPLFCVPLLVKANIDVAGMPTTAGSAALADNYPPQDARVVQLLQQQGALVLAHTAMGEFAFFPAFCLSSASGEVRNPYHLARTPAGSSGGSAAAAAASLGMAALATDTGNSVRGPASHTALVGLRPSLGLTSRAGVVPLHLDRDTGALGLHGWASNPGCVHQPAACTCLHAPGCVAQLQSALVAAHWHSDFSLLMHKPQWGQWRALWRTRCGCLGRWWRLGPTRWTRSASCAST